MENTLRHQQPYTDFSRIIRVKSEYIKEGQKIMDDKKVARINELYHKSKAEGLTPEELKEQQILRKEYIDSFKRNLRGQLNNISIKEKDGSITNLGEKFGTKKEIRHKIIRLRKEMDPLVWQQATNTITETVIIIHCF